MEQKTPQQKINELRDTQRVQAILGDDYHTGLFNGLELASAIGEGREPQCMPTPTRPEPGSLAGIPQDQGSYVSTAAEAAVATVTHINDALRALQAGKPTERSDKARRWAIVITELEKAKAIAESFLFSA